MLAVDPATSSIHHSIWTARRKLWASGYWPVAVYSHDAKVNSPGKQPVGGRWQERPRGAEPNAVTAAPIGSALNTGILCDGLRAIDIDIDCYETVKNVSALIASTLGGAPVRYRNDSARRLMLFRAAIGEPRKRLIAGLRGKVEILGRGQQFVALGTHPGGSQYRWEPEDFSVYHFSQLNAVTEDQLFQFLTSVAPAIEASFPLLHAMENGFSEELQRSYIQQPPTEHERAHAIKALAGNVAELGSMQSGSGRNNALNGLAYRMGRMVGAGWIDHIPVEQALVEASRQNGYEAKDGLEAVRKTLQSGLRRGIDNPHPPLRELPVHECVSAFSRQVQCHLSNPSKIHSLTPVPSRALSLPTDHALIMHRVADVEAQPVHWLWPPRIALGKVTLISGDPGLGKSQLTAFLAATISVGGFWPNNHGQSPSGAVLMLSCEDDVADTIRPRLEAVGADLRRVHVIEAVRVGERQSRGFSITADLAHLEAALKAHPDVRRGNNMRRARSCRRLRVTTTSCRNTFQSNSQVPTASSTHFFICEFLAAPASFFALLSTSQAFEASV